MQDFCYTTLTGRKGNNSTVTIRSSVSRRFRAELSPSGVKFVLVVVPLPEARLLEFLLSDGNRRHFRIVQTQADLRLARQPPGVDTIHPI